ncbi:replication factor c subunit 4 [Anaeramoeba ignava]|uniref:Replication factor c subunit 4 n=1 Tax=Anaeramoeba ignava TaxID=1746090 RepID=A0A9Q0L6Y7_ANAIG|nr:replication factor c subunit 4 [Anaeramoeba ignava]
MNLKKSIISIPWTEKYRPKTIDEVAHQSEVVDALKNSLKTENIPHILFYGPPGTGKTSTILAIATQLFGPKLFRSRVLELNASDERGIQVIRDKVKKFAQLSAIQKDDRYPSPAFKIIILDECDSMTQDAQNALRRIMEQYSKETRFCIICNYISKIIDPLASRCAKFRFKPIPEKIMQERLNFIAKTEGIEIEEKALEALMESSQGDLRKAITILQSTSKMISKKTTQSKPEEKKMAIEEEDTNIETEPNVKITEELIFDVSCSVPLSVVKEFIESCKASSINELVTTCQKLINSAFSIPQILLLSLKMIIEDNFLNNLQKAEICEKISEIESRLIDGADELLQLMELGVCILENYR